MSGKPSRKTVAEKIAEGIVYDPNTGCALWCGGVDSEGYGHMRVNGKAVGLHRLQWTMEHAPVPTGLVIDHLCHVRRCCRVEHLRVVTPRQNATENSTSVSAINAAKSVCPKCGGQYSLLNSERRHRTCKRCKAHYDAKRNAKESAE